MNVGEACTQCGAAVVVADRFCESCGTVQSAVRCVTVPHVAETSDVCSDCGDGTYIDRGTPATKQCAVGSSYPRSGCARLSVSSLAHAWTGSLPSGGGRVTRWWSRRPT